jgi:hypothetical protein
VSNDLQLYNFKTQMKTDNAGFSSRNTVVIFLARILSPDVKLASMISDLDLFAMVSGHVCANVALASRDGWEEDGSDVELWKRDGVSCRDYSG